MMNSRPSPDDATIVCVTYNSGSIIASLAGTLQPFRNIVIVDNGSQDETCDAITQLIPHAKLVRRDTNAGFGAANNQAMSHVGTPFALLLNPDCSISRDSLQALLDCMQRFPKAGLVGPQNWRDETTPQISFREAFYKIKSSKPKPTVPDRVVNAEWIHGCCQLIRTSAFHEIGGFDEMFFLYYEDDDLCLRMRRAGFDCLMEPAANAMHAGGKSSTPNARTSFIKHFHYARSRQLAIRRYVGIGAARLHVAKLLVAAVPAIPLYLLLMRPQHSLKWAAWGYAALSQALSLGVMPGKTPRSSVTSAPSR